MRHLYLLSIFCFLSFSLLGQQATVITGGNASSIEGHMSYSVGEVAISSTINENGIISEGVQQPFEIFTTQVLSTLDIDIELSYSVYPNPTSNNINLQLSKLPLAESNYVIYDVKGLRISHGYIATTKNVISMENLSAGTYFLTVMTSAQQLKTFKIIKK